MERQRRGYITIIRKSLKILSKNLGEHDKTQIIPMKPTECV
jgi:hypothetical protein